jgi:hypothetical protein
MPALRPEADIQLILVKGSANDPKRTLTLLRRTYAAAASCWVIEKNCLLNEETCRDIERFCRNPDNHRYHS